MQDKRLVALLGLAHGLSHFFQLVIPPLFPWIMPEFKVGYAQMGSVMTVFFVASSLGQAANGFLVDRFGPKRCLMAGVALLALSGALLSVADQFVWLYGVALLAGLGNCVFHPADYAIMNRAIAAERLPWAFSIHAVLGNAGWAAAPICMVAIVSVCDSWRAAAAAAALLAFLTWLLLVANSRFFDQALAQTQSTQSSSASQSGLGFLMVPSVWLCFAFFFFTSFALCSLQSFAPSIFHHLHGMSIETATSTLTCFIVGSSIGIVLGGWVGKRFPASEHIVMVCMLFCALMAAMTAWGWPVGESVLVWMFLTGLGVGIASPSRDMMIRTSCLGQLGFNSFGRVYGFTYCGMDVGSTLAPLLAGPLMDAQHFSAVLWIVAGLYLCGAASAVAVRLRSPQPT